MATIKVYNNDTNRMETYYRGENEAMPYITNSTLKVKEFRGSSKSDILWTEKRAMESWNRFRAMYGKPIIVGFAFKRPYEGGHGQQSQHYAGVSFDVGHNLTNAERVSMRNLAIRSGLWTYVEPVSLSPRWVHFDKRRGVPACPTGGYPLVKNGSRGAYVLILQDSLNSLGYPTRGLDGIFGSGTRSAVVAFQRSKGLSTDGIVGCKTWTTLMRDVVGN
ncbi:MAG: peptidoglycan-binding domain-containing protein [Clostridia bacterium]|nr:peptidoglycan-binding domain-containing protein [Clostridia bacterium]